MMNNKHNDITASLESNPLSAELRATYRRLKIISDNSSDPITKELAIKAHASVSNLSQQVDSLLLTMMEEDSKNDSTK